MNIPFDVKCSCKNLAINSLFDCIGMQYALHSITIINVT